MVLYSLGARVALAIRALGLVLVGWTLFDAHPGPASSGRGLVITVLLGVGALAWIVWAWEAYTHRATSADLFVMTAAGGLLVGAAPSAAGSAFAFVAIVTAGFRLEFRRAVAVPQLDGVEATRQIRSAHPQIEIVVLTTYADDASILGALQAGARGYLTKDAGAAEIARAVHAAAAGQTLLDPAVQQRLLAAAADGRPEPPRHPASLPDELTPREAEVLGLIAAGLSNAEIAARLVISEATVKTHVNHVFAKTGARDRAQAVHYAYQHGLAGR